MMWYRNTFWWTILCIAFACISYFVFDQFGWDIKFVCGYAFAQIYYQ